MTKNMKNRAIINKLSIGEKLKLLRGKYFWNTVGYEEHGIRSIKVSDSPHGLRCQKESADMIGINKAMPATCFPAGVTSSATWNRDLLKKEGAAIGK